MGAFMSLSEASGEYTKADTSGKRGIGLRPARRNNQRNQEPNSRNGILGDVALERELRGVKLGAMLLPVLQRARATRVCIAISWWGSFVGLLNVVSPRP